MATASTLACHVGIGRPSVPNTWRSYDDVAVALVQPEVVCAQNPRGIARCHDIAFDAIARIHTRRDLAQSNFSTRRITHSFGYRRERAGFRRLALRSDFRVPAQQPLT